jgi:hypothetical protein
MCEVAILTIFLVLPVYDSDIGATMMLMRGSALGSLSRKSNSGAW